MSKQYYNPLKIEKSKLAKILLISEATLRRMLNDLYFDELSQLGYSRNQKYLYKKQLDYLFPGGILEEKKAQNLQYPDKF